MIKRSFFRQYKSPATLIADGLASHLSGSLVLIPTGFNAERSIFNNVYGVENLATNISSRWGFLFGRLSDLTESTISTSADTGEATMTFFGQITPESPLGRLFKVDGSSTLQVSVGGA